MAVLEQDAALVKLSQPLLRIVAGYAEDRLVLLLRCLGTLRLYLFRNLFLDCDLRLEHTQHQRSAVAGHARNKIHGADDEFAHSESLPRTAAQEGSVRESHIDGTVSVVNVNRGDGNKANGEAGNRLLRTRDDQCSVCHQSDARLCGRCRQARYCSRHCQHLDWSRHKMHCRRDDSSLRHINVTLADLLKGVSLQAECTCLDRKLRDAWFAFASLKCACCQCQNTMPLDSSVDVTCVASECAQQDSHPHADGRVSQAFQHVHLGSHLVLRRRLSPDLSVQAFAARQGRHTTAKKTIRITPADAF